MLPEDLEQDIAVFPDNELAVAVFLAMATQWRHASMGGVTGFDYAALPAVMDLCEVEPARRRDVFGDLRVMERAVLELKAEERADG